MAASQWVYFEGIDRVFTSFYKLKKIIIGQVESNLLLGPSLSHLVLSLNMSG